MPEAVPAGIEGRRLLIVEDEYLIAFDLAHDLENLGLEVVGPAGSVEDALKLVERDGDRLDAALLDINLGDRPVYPVANALAERGIPFAFTTGYDAVAIPDAYATAPRCEKPVDKTQLLRWLSNASRAK
jgi:CheY-like chemotaxis protein